jgi:antitoxin HigA-1
MRRTLLGGMGLKQARVARAIGIPRSRLCMILSGRRPVSPEIALRIERVFGISPRFWLELTTEFDLYVERRRLSRDLSNLPHWNGDLPKIQSSAPITGG